jgi:hypothetical protein
MLDFNLLIKSTQQERHQIVFAKLIKEVPEIIAKFKFKEFDLMAFSADWFQLITNIEQ